MSDLLLDRLDKAAAQALDLAPELKALPDLIVGQDAQQSITAKGLSENSAIAFPFTG